MRRGGVGEGRPPPADQPVQRLEQPQEEQEDPQQKAAEANKQTNKQTNKQPKQTDAHAALDGRGAGASHLSVCATAAPARFYSLFWPHH
jgi:hypothetical protein